MNGVTGLLARLTVILGWLVGGSTATGTDPVPALELNFAWELYGLAALAVVACYWDLGACEVDPDALLW